MLTAARDQPARYLIVHGDDAGMSHSVNRGTVQAMEKGIVSSASIMVPCPWFSEIADYARKHPEKDFGLHLTLNSEWAQYRWGPVASRDRVPSLVDADGFLWKSAELVAKNAKAEEVEVEIRAQIEKARKFGVPISHLDTHMGALVSRPDLIDVYVKLGLEYDIPVLLSRNIQGDLAKAYPALAEKSGQVIPALEARRFPVVDDVPIVPAPKEYEQRKAAYLRALRNLKPGVSEIIIHCGVDDEELRGITPRFYNRDNDRRVFTDPDVIAEINRLGIQVINWKQFRAMTAKGTL